ncbi:uncharacterized protein L969DRAFT_87334 [Mixia osmundae IAM 14324]|uniref:ribonuclease T2 n=1 Tax=Mixia osmundae (strain CBS 9802 / IAM 14324 / JCM 22182 / KY 12970) TaxID=764103 RepID=G7E3I0_MIXOS|nr:uncharacterized protein L969DRAFT_87334 [Mixia osmundae IAM 14324]KEI39377.1 hypothetical protein L969DRAFT_87334 [Mixia osmundae IAM 14324]GAA97390.1 hypothetical protein E5Q_04068 [Mixia osmundae IAM 14324]
MWVLVTALTLGLYVSTSSASVYLPIREPAVCPIAASCPGGNAGVNTCCTPLRSSGGVLALSTQFWSAQGPSDAATLHGLWPDFCNGSYPQYCDDGRDVSGSAIRSILQKYNQVALLAFMDKYWLGEPTAGQSAISANDDFYSHEFEKHATCTPSFDLQCYGNANRTETSIVDFFNTAVGYYQRFPTYHFLTSRGISPSTTENYTLGQVQSVLRSYTGGNATLNCVNGALSEIWYSFYFYGRIQDYAYRGVDATYAGSCPASFKWLPKSAL